MKEKKFYGYKAALAMALLAFSISGVSALYVCYMPDTIARLGCTQAAIGSAISVVTVLGFATSFIAGKMYQLLGANKCEIIWGVFAFAFVAAFVWAPALWMIYVIAVGYGFFTGFTSTAAANVYVSEWFVDRREEISGYVVGMFSFGGCVGSLAYSLLVGKMGSPTITVLFVIFAVIFVASAFFVRSAAKMKQLPLGYKAEEKPESVDTGVELSGMTTKEVLRSPSFYVFCISSILVGIGVCSVGFLTLIGTGGGLSSGTSSLLYTLYTLINGLAIMVSGKIYAKIGTKKALLIYYILFLIGLVVMWRWCVSGGGAFSISLGVFVVALGISGIMLMAAMAYPALYGMKAFAGLMPVLTGVFVGGSGVGATLLTAIATNSGSWSASLFTALVCVTVSGILMIVVFLVKKK